MYDRLVVLIVVTVLLSSARFVSVSEASVFFFLMIRRPPRSTLDRSAAASDVYKRQDPDNRRMMRFDDELNENEKQTFNHVSKLIHIRKEHPALRYGDFLTLQADENIYAYLRSDMNERVLVIVNKNPNEQRLELSLPTIYKVKKAKEIISSKVVEILNYKLITNVAGLRASIFLLE